MLSVCVVSVGGGTLFHFRFLFPFNNFWRDVLISFKFCKTLYNYKVQVNLDIGNHPPTFGWVMALFRLTFCCSFLLNNFWRDALISFKLCRTLYHCKIQVKFDIGNHPPNFGLAEFWPFFYLVFVVCFCSIIFEGMHWFHSNFAELYITAKYMSSSKLVIIRQILAELWPFFNLVFVGTLILVSDQ